jgi:hypothetical protein
MKSEIEPQAESPSKFPGVAKVPRRKAKRKAKRDRDRACGGGRSAGGSRGGKAPAGGSLGGSRDYNPTVAEAVEARAKIHAMLAWDDGFPVRPPAESAAAVTYWRAWRAEIAYLGERHSDPIKAKAILEAQCN